MLPCLLGARRRSFRSEMCSALISDRRHVAARGTAAIASYRAILMKETVLGIKAAEVTAKAIKLSSALPESR